MRGLVTPVARVALAVVALTVITNCGDDPAAPEEGGVGRGGSGIALATASNGAGLTISTDKDDYAPGDTVWFTGTGWTAGDSLDIVLTDSPTGDRHEWSVGIAADGMFRDSTYVVDTGDLGVSFTLTATSRANVEQTLTVNFTDGQPQSVTVTATDDLIPVGGTATYDVAVTMGGNSNACTINLSATGLPGGTSASFTGNPRVLPGGSGSTSFNSTLSLITTGATPPGTYTFTVKAARGTGCQGTLGDGPTTTGTLKVFGSATKLAFAQQPSTSDATVSIAPAVTVQVLDANNNLVETSSASILLAIGTNPGSGTLTGTATQSAANGVATFAGLSIDKAGTGYTLTASSSGLTGATSNTFNITIGPATKLVFSTPVSGGTTGTAFSPQPVVQVQDAGGNVKTNGPGSGVNIGLAIVPGTGTSGAVLSCTTNPLGASSGQAVFAGCSINLAGTGYRLRASATINGNPFTIDSDPFNVASSNQAPAVSAGGPYSGSEGIAINFASGASQPSATDPDGDALLYKWTYTAGAGVDAAATCSFSNDAILKPTITCTDNGAFTAKLEVDDQNGHVVSSDATVTVSNTAPTATGLSTNSPVDEGSDIVFSLTGATDVSSVDATSLRYAFDCDDGNGYSAATYATASTTNSATCSTNDNGTRTVKGKVFDKDGGISTAQTTLVTIVNVPPTATGLSTNSPVDEGSDIQLSVTGASDVSTVDAASLRFAFDCGDGSGFSAASYAAASPTNSASCPTDDNGTRTVKGKVFDKDGGVSGVQSASVTINNVPPSIGTITKSNGDPLPTTAIIGATLEIQVPFTDPGTADTHKAKIDCGSGTYSDVNSGNDIVSGFTVSCTFSTVGSKTVRVKVTDDDGDYDVETFTVGVQYDFSGLFAPVDKPNTYNVSKAGQGIPLKWLLKDANHNPVTTLATVKVVVQNQSTCDANNGDLLEEYATGQSGLQNFLDGNYQFNWATPKSYAKSCKTIGLDLGEGFVRTNLAWFTFKP